MADTNQILRLAAIIREVDGNHSKGAAALAESILDHPDFRAALAKADEPTVPECREPAAVAGQPSDEEWDALVERVWDKYQTVGYQGERFMYDGDFGSALDLVRKELSLWGNPVPAPPVEGEWQTGLPSFAGFYYVRGLLDESIGGDNRPVYVNPKHFVWGFWEQDDPEWIGLDSDITPDNIQWKPVAPLPSPVADGEVAELVSAVHAAYAAYGWVEEKQFIRFFDEVSRLASVIEEGCDCSVDGPINWQDEIELMCQRLKPVPVSERPWEREGWCDPDGLCWLGSEALDGCTPTWLYGPPAWAERFPNVHRVLLPAHALPLPEVGE